MRRRYICQIRSSDYVKPRPNIPLNVAFLPTAICKHQKTDIDDTITATFKRRLKIATKISIDFASAAELHSIVSLY